MEWAKNGQPACAPGANASTWNGVQCSNGRVSALALHFSNLYGPVSTSLGNLSQLTFLILDSNALSGAWASEDVPPFCFRTFSLDTGRSLTKAAPLSRCNPVLIVRCCAAPRNAARVIWEPQAADLPQPGHELVVRQVPSGRPLRMRSLLRLQDAACRLDSAGYDQRDALYD